MKKIAALLLTALLAVLCCAALAETSVPWEYIVGGPVSGDWVYKVLYDGTVEIIQYTNTDATEVTLPGELDGKPVTSIDSAFRRCEKLTKIKVSRTHSTFASIDGVLYNKLTKTLVCYPRGRTDTEFVIPQGICAVGSFAFVNWESSSLTSIIIPDSVTSIGEGAFCGCSGLTSITIPDSVTSIGDGAFVRCDSLTSIQVAPQNTAYTSVDGILYNKQRTAIIRYPAEKSDKSFTIPDSVTSIGD